MWTIGQGNGALGPCGARIIAEMSASRHVLVLIPEVCEGEGVFFKVMMMNILLEGVKPMLMINSLRVNSDMIKNKAIVKKMSLFLVFFCF